LTFAVPAAASATSGSGATSLKISTFSAPDAAAILLAVPFSAKNGSVTSINRRGARSFSAATAPLPEMIFVLQQKIPIRSHPFHNQYSPFPENHVSHFHFVTIACKIARYPL
jgi:hypothetical protein